MKNKIIVTAIERLAHKEIEKCTNLIKQYKGLLYNKIEDRMGQCCAANFTLFSVWHNINIEAKQIIFYYMIKYYILYYII